MSASTLEMPQSLINQCRSLICLPETLNSKVLARSSIAPASLQWILLRIINTQLIQMSAMGSLSQQS